MYAAVLDRMEIVQTLINYGSKIDPLILHYIFENIYREDNLPLRTMNLLIDNGAEVDAINDQGHTLLFKVIDEACEELEEKYLPIIQLLIEKRADVNRPDSSTGNTPLHIACAMFNLSAVELLLKAGAKVNIKNIYEETPLNALIWDWNDYFDRDSEFRPDRDDRLNISKIEAIADLLIKEGADVSATNRRGETLLNAATNLNFFLRNKYLALMQLLIDNGCDLNARDKDGISALHKAAGRLNLQAVELLLKAGANVNIRDTRGVTPLHYLVINFNEANKRNIGISANEDKLNHHNTLLMSNLKSIAKLLIEKGCDPNQPDDNGQTALSYAEAIGLQD